MVQYPIEQLAALFREAGAAHEKAFAATRGQDPEWPSWYARYLAPRLDQALGGRVDQAALAADLEIGRASCREREGNQVGGGALKKDGKVMEGDAAATEYDEDEHDYNDKV